MELVRELPEVILCKHREEHVRCGAFPRAAREILFAAAGVQQSQAMSEKKSWKRRDACTRNL